jgi:membrane protein required for colicin V production
MAIDIIALFLLVLALFKGWTKGLVMAVFTFISYILALIIAFKFSGWVATHYLQELGEGSGRWSAILAFLLVMVIVMIAVRVTGKVIEKSLELMLMGVFNKLAGILLFGVIYFTVYAVVLIYASRFEIIGKSLVGASRTGEILLSWGSKVIDIFAEWIPELNNLFKQAVIFVKQ